MKHVPAPSQEVSRRFEKHVPNRREERKTARDRTQVPIKKNSQGCDPQDPLKNEQCQRQASGGVCVPATNGE